MNADSRFPFVEISHVIAQPAVAYLPRRFSAAGTICHHEWATVPTLARTPPVSRKGEALSRNEAIFLGAYRAR